MELNFCNARSNFLILFTFFMMLSVLIALIFSKVFCNTFKSTKMWRQRLESHFVPLIGLWKQFAGELSSSEKQTACFECFRWLQTACSVWSPQIFIRHLRLFSHWREREEKKSINGELRTDESASNEVVFPFDCLKKIRPEPRRMEQLDCGSWGFHMRWKCHTFSLIFQVKALVLRYSLETIKGTSGKNIFPLSVSPPFRQKAFSSDMINWLGISSNKLELRGMKRKQRHFLNSSWCVLHSRNYHDMSFYAYNV